MKIKLGDYNTLKIVKQVDFGIYLDGGEEGEILLPKRYVPEQFAIGDEIEVFLYLDNEERLVATTEHPLAKVGDFAYLQVAWVNEYGAFLKWGLMKDLFCPFREQKKRMEIGNSYIVHVHIDEESYRIVASAKVERYFAEDMPPYKRGGSRHPHLAKDRFRIQGHHRQPLSRLGIRGSNLQVRPYRRQDERLYRHGQTRWEDRRYPATDRKERNH